MEIEAFVSDMKNLHRANGGGAANGNPFSFYFNYELDTTIWRHIVNKEILSTYDRLLI